MPWCLKTILSIQLRTISRLKSTPSSIPKLLIPGNSSKNKSDPTPPNDILRKCALSSGCNSFERLSVPIWWSPVHKAKKKLWNLLWKNGQHKNQDLSWFELWPLYINIRLRIVPKNFWFPESPKSVIFFSGKFQEIPYTKGELSKFFGT